MQLITECCYCIATIFKNHLDTTSCLSSQMHLIVTLVVIIELKGLVHLFGPQQDRRLLHAFKHEFPR